MTDVVKPKTIVVAYESLKTKENPSWWFEIVVVNGAGRTDKLVAYESLELQSLCDNSIGDSWSWSLSELVAYESGRSESFDCIQIKMHFWIE